MVYHQGKLPPAIKKLCYTWSTKRWIYTRKVARCL